MTAILTVVFTSVFAVPVREYAPFVFLGIITWQFFTESMLQGCNAVRLGATYLRVRPIPLAIFPLRVVLSAGVHAGLGLIAAVTALGCMQGSTNAVALLWLLPAAATFVIAAWSLACLCAILHARYSDTQQVVEISLQILFYATPVIYMPASLQQTGWLHTLIACNPFSAFLDLVRQPLLYGEAPRFASLAIVVTFTAALAVIAWVALQRVEKRVVLWL
jgi:ABC-type polysaccharide/polyol phosphate export permease